MAAKHCPNQDMPSRKRKSPGEVHNPHIDFGCTLLSRQIVRRMKDYFGDDAKRIAHAMGVLGKAEMILATEPAASELVVRAAAILHDIGIHEAQRKHGSTAGHFQEIEGPPIARKILHDLDVSKNDTTHICRIIGNHHNPRGIDTLEFRIVWDADWLVNIPEEFHLSDHGKILRLVKKTFKTKRGKELGLQLVEPEPNQSIK